MRLVFAVRVGSRRRACWQRKWAALKLFVRSACSALVSKMSLKSVV